MSVTNKDIMRKLVDVSRRAGRLETRLIALAHAMGYTDLYDLKDPTSNRSQDTNQLSLFEENDRD